MLKPVLAIIITGVVVASVSAEQMDFNFSRDAVGQPPPRFQNGVTANGLPARWTVQEEEVPPMIAPIETNALVNTAKQTVLSVQSFDLDDDYYPVLLFTNEIFSDFTYTARFKIAGGVVDPSAGLIFRAQDAKNYYVVRASAAGNLLWYKVVDGKSYQNLGVGVRMPIPTDTWEELRVECLGTETRCFLNGKLAIPPVKSGAPTNGVAINDTTFGRGVVGFWSKADSHAEFADARVQYTPHVPYVQIVINDMIRKHPALLGLKVFAPKPSGFPVVIGCSRPQDVGEVGTKTEQDVLERGSIYYLKQDKAVEVTVPLRDRNGDVEGALKVRMKTFRGETETTAVTKATLIKKEIELQIETMQDING